MFSSIAKVYKGRSLKEEYCIDCSWQNRINRNFVSILRDIIIIVALFIHVTMFPREHLLEGANIYFGK